MYRLFRAYFRKGCRLLFSQQLGSFQCDGFAAADQQAAAAGGPGKRHGFGQTPAELGIKVVACLFQQVRHLSAVIGLAEEEGAEAFFSALESGLTAETQKKDRTTMPGMSENPFDKVFLVPPAGTDAAMTERLLEKARYHFDAELCGSLAEAMELARANSRRGLLICGGEAIALEAAELLAEK